MTEQSAGLRRKIWIAFILQAAAISFAAVLGVYGASAVLKHLLIQRALTEEASHFWKRSEANPAAAVPDTFNMTGFVVDDAAERGRLPDALQPLPEGYHSLPRSQGGALVFVESRGGRTLYLLFKQEQVDALAFWFGVVPLALVLIVVYVIAWTTYRASRRAVSPVIWLASQVQRWDPKHPEVSSLKPENLPVDVEGETLVLASSLHDFGMRIEELVQRERDFTRDASHELRTPLAVIRGAVELMLARPDLDHKTEVRLHRIQRAEQQCTDLIGALLLLSRNERGHGAADVGRIAEQLLDAHRGQLAGKPLELRLEGEPGQIVIDAPEAAVTVALSNLIGNAVKYTPDGEVRVRLRDNAVDVIDTGPGLSAEDAARLFERGYRGSHAEHTQGGGIGLSIVRRLCALYGWQVKVRPGEERGVVATLTFG